MGARFISAGAMRAGVGSVVADLPPVWMPGDVFLTMGFAPPVGPDNYTPGWTRRATYNWTRVAGAIETPPTVSNSAGAGGVIAVIIACFRGVDVTKMPGTFGLSAVPEYGGETVAPGTYYPPDRGGTPKFTAGVCPYSMGPAPLDGSLAVASYQSEGSDSSPVDTHFLAGADLVQLAMDYAAVHLPANNYDYHLRLGFFSPPPISAGGYSAPLRWGTTGSGGGPSGGSSTPKAGPVAWFSQVLLAASAAPGPLVKMMPMPSPAAGQVLVKGSRAADQPVTVTATGATVGTVEALGSGAWQVLITEISGSVLVTAATPDGGFDSATIVSRTETLDDGTGFDSVTCRVIARQTITEGGQLVDELTTSAVVAVSTSATGFAEVASCTIDALCTITDVGGWVDAIDGTAPPALSSPLPRNARTGLAWVAGPAHYVRVPVQALVDIVDRWLSVTWTEPHVDAVCTVTDTGRGRDSAQGWRDAPVDTVKARATITLVGYAARIAVVPAAEAHLQLERLAARLTLVPQVDAQVHLTTYAARLEE